MSIRHYDSRAEVVPDGIQRRLSWLYDSAGRDIGIYDAYAMVGKTFGGGRFATADSTGETNEKGAQG